MTYKFRNYIDLYDTIRYIKDSGYDYFEDVDLTNFLTTLGTKLPDINTTRLIVLLDSTNQNMISLWNEILTRYRNHTCIISENEIPTSDEVSEFFARLFSKIISTKDRYLTILKAYNDLKNNLLKQIETSQTSVSRFNDTPQNGGDYSDDEHTTNITQNEVVSSSDVQSPIARLEAIENGYSDVMNKWILEVGRVFIE